MLFYYRLLSAYLLGLSVAFLWVGYPIYAVSSFLASAGLYALSVHYTVR